MTDTDGTRRTKAGERVARFSMPDIPPGHLHELMNELRELHQRAGWLSAREIARKTDNTYTAVHSLFTKTKIKAPRKRLLLQIVQMLARADHQGVDVRGVVDRFAALWQAADDAPFIETAPEERSGPAAEERPDVTDSTLDTLNGRARVLRDHAEQMATIPHGDDSVRQQGIMPSVLYSFPVPIYTGDRSSPPWFALATEEAIVQGLIEGLLNSGNTFIGQPYRIDDLWSLALVQAPIPPRTLQGYTPIKQAKFDGPFPDHDFSHFDAGGDYRTRHSLVIASQSAVPPIPEIATSMGFEFFSEGNVGVHEADGSGTPHIPSAPYWWGKATYRPQGGITDRVALIQIASLLDGQIEDGVAYFGADGAYKGCRQHFARVYADISHMHGKRVTVSAAPKAPLRELVIAYEEQGFVPIVDPFPSEDGWRLDLVDNGWHKGPCHERFDSVTKNLGGLVDGAGSASYPHDATQWPPLPRR